MQTINPANAPVKKGVNLIDGIKVIAYSINEGSGFKPTYKFATSSDSAKGECFPSKTDNVK